MARADEDGVGVGGGEICLKQMLNEIRLFIFMTQTGSFFVLFSR